MSQKKLVTSSQYNVNNISALHDALLFFWYKMYFSYNTAILKLFCNKYLTIQSCHWCKYLNKILVSDFSSTSHHDIQHHTVNNTSALPTSLFTWLQITHQRITHLSKIFIGESLALGQYWWHFTYIQIMCLYPKIL